MYKSCSSIQYARNCVVFWENLHSWPKFYTTAGHDGRDKSQLCDQYVYVSCDVKNVWWWCWSCWWQCLYKACHDVQAERGGWWICTTWAEVFSLFHNVLPPRPLRLWARCSNRTTHSPHVGLQVHAAPLSNGLGWPMCTAQWDLAHNFDSPLVKSGSSNPLVYGLCG